MDFLLKFALSILRKGNSKLMKLKKKKKNMYYSKQNVLENKHVFSNSTSGEPRILEVETAGGKKCPRDKRYSPD